MGTSSTEASVMIDKFRKYVKGFETENPTWSAISSNASYGDGEFSVKFVFQEKAEGGKLGTQVMRDDWKTYCSVFDLKEEWLDKKITMKGKEYQITGLLPNRPKNCVSITRLPDGKEFITTSDLIKRKLGTESVLSI